MILYHFTSPGHLALIQKQGLHKGMIPWRMVDGDKPTFLRNWQWLTVDPDWNQGWDNQARSLLPYRKTEWRITVCIPNYAQQHVIKWNDWCARHSPESASFLNSFPGHAHWRLFHGSIPAQWFLTTERNPTPISLTHLDEHT